MPQLQPQVQQAKQGPGGAIRSPQKITQLLCLDQNIELKSIFITWLSQSFKYLPNILSNVYLQLQLIINFIEYRFTVSRDKPQVGDYLQNVKYKNMSKKIKVIFMVVDVILPYLKRRFMMHAEKYIEKYQNQKQQNNKQLSNQSEQINKAHYKNTIKSKFINILKKILSFISLTDKLYALGKYRTLVQRILKIQMEFVNPQNSRVLDFTLMNRTMIWQIYQMVLKNILPPLYKFIGNGLKNIFYLHSYMGVDQKTDNQSCMICGDAPTMAVKAKQCGHVCCFYCSKTIDQQKMECKKCGQKIQKWVTLYGL